MATRGVAALVAVVFAIVAEASLVSAERHEYTWDINYIEAAPDCFTKTVLGINHKFPGPRIDARQGDIVRVTFINHVATEGITMHWHGIRQINSTWADGTAQVSQCPIVYGEEFTYEFTVDRPGTYFYHGHAGVQRAAGFYGALVVQLPKNKTEPYVYNREHMIILNDWWHRNVMDQERGLENSPTIWVGDPQSILLEGRGRYNCPNVNASAPGPLNLICNQTSETCDPPHIWKVTRGLTYRLRLASVTSLSSLNFKIEGHIMQVVEADGHNVEPFYTDNLDIYSGETYSVLVVCNGTLDNYHLAVDIRAHDPAKVPTGLGILNYNNAPAIQPKTSLPKGPAWNNVTASIEQARKYRFRKNNTDPTSHPYSITEHVVTRQIVLLNEQKRLDGVTKWALNNITYKPLATPLLPALVYNIPNAINSVVPPDYPAPGYNISYMEDNETTPTAGSGFYQFKTGDVVEVILQNGAMLNPKDSDLHPWHLHGHDFWIMGYGTNKFDNTTSPATFNYVDPPSRNNVALFPRGWTAIRFKLDNPGAWPFHCHIEWHFHMGMGVMFVHGIDQVRKQTIPSSTLGCGLTKTLFNLP